MKTLCVVQHTEAEYLGLVEDHLEGRNIRFRYHRPFAAGGQLATSPQGFDGLVLLGGGPYGVVSGHLLPTLGPELRLTAAFLDVGLPVLGIGIGAILLATAAGGGAEERPLRFSIESARRSQDSALADCLPETFPVALYGRDTPVLPAGAEVAATGADGTPLIFTLLPNSVGLLGHPGAKRGMMEDLVMEFADAPEHVVEPLEILGREQVAIARNLGPLMVGIVRHMALMD